MTPYRPYHVRLAGRARLSPGFVRITLAGTDLGTCSPTLLDQRVKLLLGEPDALRALVGEAWYPAWQTLDDSLRPALRTYTLVSVRPDAGGGGEVDVDVAVHPVGGAADAGAPGLRFALDAPLGTPAVLVAADATRPGHDTVGVAWRPGAATDVLLVGDETALPAVTNIVGQLASDMTGRVVLEVAQAADRRDLAAPLGVSIDWRVRARGERARGVFGRPGGPATDDGELLWDEAEGSGGRYGWVAGEAGWVRELRAEARAAGVPKGQVAFLGYWRRGAAGS